jgi:hypothetical protein
MLTVSSSKKNCRFGRLSIYRNPNAFHSWRGSTRRMSRLYKTSCPAAYSTQPNIDCTQVDEPRFPQISLPSAHKVDSGPHPIARPVLPIAPAPTDSKSPLWAAPALDGDSILGSLRLPSSRRSRALLSHDWTPANVRETTMVRTLPFEKNTLQYVIGGHPQESFMS